MKNNHLILKDFEKSEAVDRIYKSKGPWKKGKIKKEEGLSQDDYKKLAKEYLEEYEKTENKYEKKKSLEKHEYYTHKANSFIPELKKDAEESLSKLNYKGQ